MYYAGSEQVMIEDDNLIVFPPKADDNSCVFVYSSCT